MSFDRTGLIEACRRHGQVARVVVASVRGSAPREVGAAMLIWKDGMSGTIGGGALEYEAMQAARRRPEPGTRRLTRHALGPDLGQCCGGSVHLMTETFDLQLAEALATDVVARGDGDMPIAVARLKAQARQGSARPGPQLVSGWMVEPVQHPSRTLWIWGAGHVGRALTLVLSPLPEFSLTWVDTDMARFPAEIPSGVRALAAHHPPDLLRHADTDAEHLIVTFSHALDLELCHRLLQHGFSHAGLIGSATKWARFRKRLGELGHSAGAIARITCPIGRPELGKHPQAIALGVGAELLARRQNDIPMEDTA